MSCELRDALLKAKGQAECVEIPEGDHQGLFARISDGDATLQVMLKFIARQSPRSK